MIHLGKSLEALARLIRPLVGPDYRRAYSAMTARGLSQRLPGEPLVCCDFADPKIDSVGGRYYFSLVRDLIDAGYFPVFTEHRATLSTFGPSRMKSQLLERRLGTVKSVHEIAEPFLLITDSGASPERATAIVRVSYERRIPSAPGEIAFPVFVHPRIAGRLPFHYEIATARPARIFFGGNTAEDKYDKDVIGEVYSMLTRREMLETAVLQGGPENVHRPADAMEWLGSGDAHPFVLIETRRTKIPATHWLEALSRADFFLACPGVGMPLCHNLVEAMAAGAIPVLQYADYLDPPLRHGVNCLAFHDAESLRQAISRALAMADDEIRALRQGVMTYYHDQLAPGAFARRLSGGGPADKTLLLNSYRVPR